MEQREERSNAADSTSWKTGNLLEAHAREICAWTYEPPYDIYSYGSYENAVRYEEAIADETKRAQQFFGVFSEADDIMGFVELTETDSDVVIGLGLRPDLCSRGLGQALTTEAVQAARRIAKGRKITLEVRRFNRRAIICYERSGFVIVEEFERKTPTGIGDFYRMEYRGHA